MKSRVATYFGAQRSKVFVVMLILLDGPYDIRDAVFSNVGKVVFMKERKCIP